MSTEKTGIENTTAEPAKDELSEQELDKVSGGEEKEKVSEGGSESSTDILKTVFK